MVGDAGGAIGAELGVGAGSGAACAGVGFGVAPFRHLSSTQGVVAGWVACDPRKTLSQKLLCALAIAGQNNKARAKAAPVPIDRRLIARPTRKAARTGRPPGPMCISRRAQRRGSIELAQHFLADIAIE